MQLQPTTPVTIYALRDPETGTPAYVGQTALPLARRLKEHIRSRGDNCRRGRWITQLLAAGKRPAIVTLEITDHAHADEREYFHIARLWAEGYKLTNSSGTPWRRALASAYVANGAQEDAMDDNAVQPNSSQANRPNRDPERVGVGEAAELLGVHVNTVRHRLKRGLYPFDKVLTPYGSAYMIPRAAIEADLAGATTGSNGAVAPIGPNGANNVGVTAGEGSARTALSAPMSLTDVVEAALTPLVEELARARADAAAAHERAGRARAERDAAILERNMERTRRYEVEQRRPWWQFW